MHNRGQTTRHSGRLRSWRTVGAQEASSVLGERICATVLRRGARLGAPDPLARAEGHAGRPLGTEHLEDLEAHMDRLRAAIERESFSDYADLPGGDQANRTSFLAHFADLDAAVEEWDTVVALVQAAAASVWEWFAQATSERGFTEPPFAIGPLIDRLATLTLQRSRHGRRGTHPLDLQYLANRSARGEQMSLYVEGRNVAELPAESAANPQRGIAAAGQRVQDLFDDGQSSEQAAELASVRDALVAIKQPLLDRLALHASVEAVAFATSCPVCQRGARPEISARRRIGRDPGVSAVPGLSAWVDDEQLVASPAR
jgi:hypothetical protein